MKGSASTQPFSSSVARISSALRTRTQSPLRRPRALDMGPPALGEVDDAVAGVEHHSGVVDVGDLDLERRAHVAIVYRLAALAGGPQRERILPRDEVERVDLQVEVAVARLDLGDVQPVHPVAALGD